MNVNEKFAAALLWRKTSQGWHPILPFRGLGILSALVVLLGVVAGVVDIMLGNLVSQGDSNAAAWSSENTIINSQNYKKILNSQSDPIFRSVGFAAPKIDRGRKRILIIGDSFIWGDGHTNINMIWWRQLQWELMRRGYHSVDVIAAGLNGASTQDQLAWLDKPGFLEETRPDAIIFGYVTNDPQIRDEKGVDKVKQFSSSGRYDSIGKKLEQVFPHLGYELRTRMNGKLHFVPDDGTGYPYGQWELKILEGRNFEEYKQVLKKLAARLNQIGVPTLFVTTPNSPHREAFEVRYKPVAKAMQEAGLKFVDLLPAFLQCCENKVVSPYEWVVNPANGHPGPRSTHFYASQVADLLEANYRSILGEQSTASQNSAAINDWMPASLSPVMNHAGFWTFLYPENDAELLSMPVGQKHVALNFELPVSINRLAVHAEKSSNFSVWATLLNERDNYEEKQYVLMGDGKGEEAVIVLRPELAAKRITSLRIAVKPLPAAHDSVALTMKPLVVSKMSPGAGNSYGYDLPELRAEADDSHVPDKSDLMLLENGKPLDFPHTIHEEIAAKGNRRYSHWEHGLIFSSSDGSNPRDNERSYVLIRGSDWNRENANPIELNIEFNLQAVKL